MLALFSLLSSNCGLLKGGSASLNDNRPEGKVCVSGEFQGTNSITGVAYIIANTNTGQWYFYLENLSLPETNLWFEVDAANPNAILARRQVVGTSGNKTFAISTPQTGQQLVQVRSLRSSSLPNSSLSTASFGTNQCTGLLR